MSHCPYCRRELPGFETLCQQCFEAGYDRVTHPTPWWQRMRLTYDSLWAFLLVFVYVYVVGGVNRDHHPTMMGLVLLALILAAGVILIGVVLGKARKPKVVRRSLFMFAIVFLCFFVRLWQVSSYHPIPYPEFWAFLIATIAAVVESFRTDSTQSSGAQKKAPGESGAYEKNSRDAV